MTTNIFTRHPYFPSSERVQIVSNALFYLTILNILATGSFAHLRDVYFITIAIILIASDALIRQKIPKNMLYFLPLILIFASYGLWVGIEYRELYWLYWNTSALLIFLYFFHNANKINYHPLTIPIMIVFALGAIHISKFGVNDFNPNWWAMTAFFFLALSPYRTHLAAYLLLLIVTVFIYESRGTSLSIICAILVIVFSKIDLKITKIAFCIGFTAITLGLFGLIHVYGVQTNSFLVQFGDESLVSLSNRELALTEGYQQLKETFSLGKGLTAATVILLDGNPSSVKIHFGLLDIALKLSIFAMIFVILFVFYTVYKTDRTYLPVVTGGALSTFFYNGFGLTHIGLNILLLTAFGMAIKKSNPKLSTENKK